MIPNVVRGDRMAGLMTYLVGPGRANEHTEPHLVAGDAALMAWHSDNELGHDSALAIARHLDRPSKAFDVDVSGCYVWHCSLSLHPDEGMLTDEKWGDIASDFIRAMEFDDNQDTKAPCRWVAVRHGVSKNGNDHIHIAVNLVREDGTKASTHHDFRRAQTAARALEVQRGLAVVAGPGQDRSTRGYQPAERAARGRAKAESEFTQLHPGEIRVGVLDRPRHRELITEIRAAGAATRLLLDGDVAGGIVAASSDESLDLCIGTGGSPEGVATACAIKALDGFIQTRLAPGSDDERQRGLDAGLKFDHVYEADELVSSNNTFFVATGVTDGNLVRGVRRRGRIIHTESIVLRSRSGTVRRVAADHLAQKWLNGAD